MDKITLIPQTEARQMYQAAIVREREKLSIVYNDINEAIRRATANKQTDVTLPASFSALEDKNRLIVEAELKTQGYRQCGVTIYFA